MDGLVVDYPLTIAQFFERSRRVFARKTLATRIPGEAPFRYTYAEFAERVGRLAGGLEGILPTQTVLCLAYVGGDDPIRPRVEDWVRAAPDAALVVLPGLDHWAGMYRADLMLPQVRAFLDRVARAQAPSA